MSFVVSTDTHQREHAHLWTSTCEQPALLAAVVHAAQAQHKHGATVGNKKTNSTQQDRNVHVNTDRNVCVLQVFAPCIMVLLGSNVTGNPNKNMNYRYELECDDSHHDNWQRSDQRGQCVNDTKQTRRKTELR